MAKALVIKGADFSVNKLGTITFEGVHTTAVNITDSTLEFTGIGDTQTLECTVTPSDSVDPVIWTTSDTTVATVANGIVTSVGLGTCTITATSGSYSDTCEVTVAINQYLEGQLYTKTLVDPRQSGNDHFTRLYTLLGDASTTRNGQVSLIDSVSTYDGEMLLTSMAVNKASSGYDFQIATSVAEMDESNMKRIFNNIGYPLPIKLPEGATKLRCIAPSDQYAPRVIFFDTSIRASSTNDNANGGNYYCAWRRGYTPTAADYEWVYENNLEFDIPAPEGGATFDAVAVAWQTNPNDSTAVLPTDMTAEQLAQFKVLCL